MPIAKLDRTVLHLSGEGVYDWLEGLITNKINPDPKTLTFAALLTPQGKIIADFFVWPMEDGFVIETPQKFGAGLHKRLKMYRLRAPIQIEDKSDGLSVYAIWGGLGAEGRLDPRSPFLGHRILSSDLQSTHSEGDYDQFRLMLGIPDSQWDFGTGEVFPANANMDVLHGVDFKKGCFVGQEVVSRMYRKTDIRKRMRGFNFEGSVDGDVIKIGERVVGDIMHISGQAGMAMMRLDRLAKTDGTPMIGDTEIKIDRGPLDIRRNDISALPSFAALNAAWIEDLHFLEESDKKMVAHPEIYLENEGSVFSVHIDGEVAGVCALKQDKDGAWELTKMAVDPKFQGRGIGQDLMDVVELYAKNEMGLAWIYLLSNTGNEAAIRLYKRNGWDIIFINEPHPTYARCNIGMEKTL